MLLNQYNPTTLDIDDNSIVADDASLAAYEDWLDYVWCSIISWGLDSPFCVLYRPGIVGELFPWGKKPGYLRCMPDNACQLRPLRPDETDPDRDDQAWADLMIQDAC